MNKKSAPWLLKKENRAAYYAINNEPKYTLFTKISIESLRKFNNKLKVYLFIYGDLADIDLSFFHKKNINIINKGAVTNEHFTSLKWFSLQDLVSFQGNSLIYLDADTIFFKDVDILFENFKKFDFYAREEVATQKDKGIYSIGKASLAPQLNHNIYQQVIKRLGAINLPIFNTGVVLFNNESFKKVASLIGFYKYVMDNFRKKRLPYPCLNPHIIEEIVASITLGKIPDLTYGILDNKTLPSYIEFKEGQIKKTGVVMHIWNAFYRSYLLDYASVL